MASLAPLSLAQVDIGNARCSNFLLLLLVVHGSYIFPLFLNRSANHYIKPGIEPMTILDFNVVIYTSMRDLLYSPISKFNTKFYIQSSAFYA